MRDDRRVSWGGACRSGGEKEGEKERKRGEENGGGDGKGQPARPLCSQPRLGRCTESAAQVEASRDGRIVARDRLRRQRCAPCIKAHAARREVGGGEEGRGNERIDGEAQTQTHR